MQMPWLAQVLVLAKEAGQATLSYRPTLNQQGHHDAESLQVTQKMDNTPVTQADLVANQIIVDGLARLTPDIAIVSEEVAGSERFLSKQGRFWLVDPLDGTSEFVDGGQNYTVNIALIEEGRAIWGVVYVPVISQLYWGGQAWGSFLQQESGEHALAVQSAIVAQQPIRVLASKRHLNTKTRDFMTRLGTTQLERAASSLKFCLIADGKADIYPRLGDTSQWDTAAAQAVLEGAGGTVCDLQGKPLRYGQPHLLNPHFIASGLDPKIWMDALRPS